MLIPTVERPIEKDDIDFAEEEEGTGYDVAITEVQREKLQSKLMYLCTRFWKARAQQGLSHDKCWNFDQRRFGQHARHFHDHKKKVKSLAVELTFWCLRVELMERHVMETNEETSENRIRRV